MADGRSTPGAPQPNNGSSIEFRKTVNLNSRPASPELLDDFGLRVEQPQVRHTGLAVDVHAWAAVQCPARRGQHFRDQLRHALELAALDRALVSGPIIVVIRLDGAAVIEGDGRAASGARRALAPSRKSLHKLCCTSECR